MVLLSHLDNIHIIINRMSILSVNEARELFDSFLLGSLDSAVQQTTLKILEKTILKGKQLFSLKQIVISELIF